MKAYCVRRPDGSFACNDGEPARLLVVRAEEVDRLPPVARKCLVDIDGGKLLWCPYVEVEIKEVAS